eukprot:jgi/Tetstr1/441129/TSEL_029390.t1
MLQKSSDFTTWKQLYLSFINTSVPEVMEQMILLDRNDPNIDPQLQSNLYHTLVQIAQHHPSATSELKNLSQSTAVSRDVTDQPSDDTDAGDELTLEEEEMLLNEVRHYYLKYWAESSGPFAPEVRFDRDSIFETDAMDALAIKDGIHLKMLVSEILASPVQTLIMMEDNQGAISYATNVVISDMTKHIDVKWHFVKDHVEAGTGRVNYIATDVNTADMMTKPLPCPALEKHARFAMGWGARRDASFGRVSRKTGKGDVGDQPPVIPAPKTAPTAARVVKVPVPTRSTSPPRPPFDELERVAANVAHAKAAKDKAAAKKRHDIEDGEDNDDRDNDDDLDLASLVGAHAAATKAAGPAGKGKAARGKKRGRGGQYVAACQSGV